MRHWGLFVFAVFGILAAMWMLSFQGIFLTASVTVETSSTPVNALAVYSDQFDVPIGGGRRLVVCVDGTWNSPGSLSDAESMGGFKETAALAPSNIVKLAYLMGSGVHQFDPAANQTWAEYQKVYYHSGVATEQKDQKEAQLEGNFGNIHGHVLDAYAWLAKEYRAGDEIYAFGFSRGATIVRSLFSFIRFVGLVDVDKFDTVEQAKEEVMNAFNLYRQRLPATNAGDHAKAYGLVQKAEEFKRNHAHPHVDLKFIGVMETVEALDVPDGYSNYISSKYLTDAEEMLGAIEPNNYHDLSIGNHVQYAYHALAADEAREFFPPTPFETPSKSLPASYIREQKWFRGSHADIGGGWFESGLSDITLHWMIEKARAAGLIVRDVAEWEKAFYPMLLGISKSEYLRRKESKIHDYFEWIGSTDGKSPQGRRVPRDIKNKYMDTTKFAPSSLHESVFDLFKGDPVPQNLVPFLG